ncbi:MAG: oligoribonuclease [Candidatus Nanopelagicales bacterium]
MSDADRLVWVDLEMTGLLPSEHAIVEIACVVTDAQLNPLDGGISRVIFADDSQLALMDSIVVKMHTESGLITEIPNGVPLQDAEADVLDYIKSHIAEPKKSPLAGSSVYVDRMFLQAHMPALESYLHYRIVDVSSVKELTRRWYPRMYFAAPTKNGNHRALADIFDSIRELSYYRQTVFAETDKYSIEQAKEIAELMRGQKPEGEHQ